jgi:Fungal Zn(2)-Cys(6) binuclear cluster domain
MNTTGINASKVPVAAQYVLVANRDAVMRACEGCRRRKIKCDSATTNTWPCAACTRLKLTCIPPTLNEENGSTSPNTLSFEIQKSRSFPIGVPTTVSDYSPHVMQHQFAPIETPIQPHASNMYPGVSVYQPSEYIHSPTGTDISQYHPLSTTSVSVDPASRLLFSPHQQPQSAMSERSWVSESSAIHLAEAFGDLKINVNAQGRCLFVYSVANNPSCVHCRSKENGTWPCRGRLCAAYEPFNWA